MSYKTVTGWFGWLWRSLVGPFTPSAPEPVMSEDEAVAILNHECNIGLALTSTLARLNSITLKWACPECGRYWALSFSGGVQTRAEAGVSFSSHWYRRVAQAKRTLGIGDG